MYVGVPSRVWKAEGKPSFTKHQCYLEVGSLLWQERSVATGKRRLQYSELPEGMKHPVILLHGHTVVKEIIQSVQKELLHAGPESTLSVLRQANWLTKGRREVKRVLGKCLVCQRQHVGPRSQKMALLPSEWVPSSSAFTLRSPTSTKAHICIFASSGMTHLCTAL